MGVAGLWSQLASARSASTFAQLVESNYDRPERGYRVAIDASIWNFHTRKLAQVQAAAPDQDVGACVPLPLARVGRESDDARSRRGSNPELRTIFFRLLKLLSYGVLPLCVFDGPDKPQHKRGNYISGAGDDKFERELIELLEAMALPWLKARGEAEAEIAYLNQLGYVDACLTDDSDTLLFGAPVVRSPLHLVKSSIS
jgi:Holliday junction resolvase YEN1